MARIYDILRAGTAVNGDDSKLAQTARIRGSIPDKAQLHRMLSSAQVIDTTNVTAYYEQHEGASDKTVFKSYPQVVPPWAVAFFQSYAPKTYWTGLPAELRAKMDDNILREMFLQGYYADEFGAMALTVERQDFSLLVDLPGLMESEGARQALDESRWLTIFYMFVKSRFQGASKVSEIGSVYLPIRPDGTFVIEGEHRSGYAWNPTPEIFDSIQRFHAAFVAPHQSFGDYLMDYISGISNFYLHPLLLAISFLHCKNVSMKLSSDVPMRPLKRAQIKRGEKPIPHYRFHELNIEPMKQVLTREGDIEHTGMQRALHICRGHFATYTDEHPLFGKVTGTFWKPQHIRGTATAGVVAKDYNIMQPKPVKND